VRQRWREHRDARDLFAPELAGARTFLRESPTVGSKYTVLDGLPVRRVLLPKTGAHVYPLESTSVVERSWRHASTR
jgi:hypothetical protein